MIDGEALLLGKAGAGIWAVTIGVDISSNSHLRQAYTSLLRSFMCVYHMKKHEIKQSFYIKLQPVFIC